MHHYHGSTGRVVETRGQHSLVGLYHVVACCLGACVLRREWIIDDDDIEPASGHTSVYGSGETATSLIRFKIKSSVAIGCQTRPREDLAVPPRLHDTVATNGKIIGEGLTMRDHCDALCGVIAQQPGRKSHGGDQAL